ncbi:MAG: UvrD-helicase domain-containing protein [Desulfomicrobium escambiense]|nr:UvrD-helicase domain-containing protein [Desulfomicrobium escambiense]
MRPTARSSSKEILKGHGNAGRQGGRRGPVGHLAGETGLQGKHRRRNRAALLSGLRFAPVAELYQQSLWGEATPWTSTISSTMPSISCQGSRFSGNAGKDRFDYILVDEYQDTNKVQYLLVNLLAGDRGNVCVVGDPAACIYALERRPSAQASSTFPATSAHPERKLEVNYGVDEKILDVANRIIAEGGPHVGGRGCSNCRRTGRDEGRGPVQALLGPCRRVHACGETWSRCLTARGTATATWRSSLRMTFVSREV